MGSWARVWAALEKQSRAITPPPAPQPNAITPPPSPDRFRPLMEALGGPEDAFDAVADRRLGAPAPVVDAALGTAGAKGNDPRLAAFDRYAHGAKSASKGFGPDAIVPIQLAITGGLGAGYEGFKKLFGKRGLRRLARITGDPDFASGPETTSPASAENVRAFVNGLIEGGIYNRGMVPPPPDLRLPQHPASSAVERAAQRFKR